MGLWTNTSRAGAPGASSQIEKEKKMDSLMVDELFVASVDNAKEKDKHGYKGHSI